MPRHYKKRKYYKKNKSTKAIAYKALKIAKKASASIETKFIDTPIPVTSVNWSGTPISQLNDSLQGLADNEHVGDQVLITSIRWRGQFSNNGSNASHMRMIVFYDKYNTVNSPGDILEVTGTAQSTVSDYTIDKRSDYIILFDRVFNVDGTALFTKYSRGRKRIMKKTKFDSGTSSIEKGVIKHFAISDLDPTATPQCQYQMYFRVYYNDA